MENLKVNFSDYFADNKMGAAALVAPVFFVLDYFVILRD